MSSAKILYVQGRQHPVKILHTAVGQTDYVDAALRTFFQIHTTRPPGAVLIFLPGLFFILTLTFNPVNDHVLRSRGYRELGKVNTAICEPVAERGHGGTCLVYISHIPTVLFYTPGDHMPRLCCASSWSAIENVFCCITKHS